jgi:hypothetical protein
MFKRDHLYQDTIKQALSAENDESRLVNVAQVQIMEETNQDMFLFGEVSDAEEQLDVELVTMRETAYFARDGDYFSDSSRRFRRAVLL